MKSIWNDVKKPEFNPLCKDIKTDVLIVGGGLCGILCGYMLKNAQKINAMYVDENMLGLSFRSYGDILLLGGGSHRTGQQGGCWEELEGCALKYNKQEHSWDCPCHGSRFDEKGKVSENPAIKDKEL